MRGRGHTIAMRGGRELGPPGPVGPQIRGAISGVNNTVPQLAENEVGDLLLVWASASGNLGTPSGWTQTINRLDVAGNRLFLYSKISSGGETTLGSLQVQFAWQALSIRDATAVDASVSGSGTAATITFPAVDPSAAPTLLIDAAHVAWDAGTSTITMPADETALDAVVIDGFALRVAHKTLLTDAAQSARSGNRGDLGVWASGTVVVR